MGPFGTRARLPSPLEPPKSQGSKRVVVDFRHDKTFGIDVYILTDALALTVISPPPSMARASVPAMTSGACLRKLVGAHGMKRRQALLSHRSDKAEGINGLFACVILLSSPSPLLFPKGTFSDVLVPLGLWSVIVLPCHGSLGFSGPKLSEWHEALREWHLL